MQKHDLYLQEVREMDFFVALLMTSFAPSPNEGKKVKAHSGFLRTTAEWDSLFICTVYHANALLNKRGFFFFLHALFAFFKKVEKKLLLIHISPKIWLTLSKHWDSQTKRCHRIAKHCY